MTICLAGMRIAAIPPMMPGFALVQTYPDKPDRLVVPHPPSTSTDVLGRRVAQKMSASIGHALVLDSHSWAGGNTGSEPVAEAVAKRLSDEVIKTVRDTELEAKLTVASRVVVGGTPAEFAITVKRDFELLRQADPKNWHQIEVSQ